MGLEFEYQHHPNAGRIALEANLRENGASAADIAFMFHDFNNTRSVRRVELNAMTGPQFVEFVERKLRESGVEKVIPNADLLVEAYEAMERGRRLAEAMAKLDQITSRDAPRPPRRRRSCAALCGAACADVTRRTGQVEACRAGAITGRSCGSYIG